jgi:hypothetical protein
MPSRQEDPSLAQAFKPTLSILPKSYGIAIYQSLSEELFPRAL